MEKTYKTCNRYFSAILYEEDPNYTKYFNEIQRLYTEVTYIVHDKDKEEDGTPKKPHTHIIFKVGKCARWVSSIAKETEIPIQYLERLQ